MAALERLGYERLMGRNCKAGRCMMSPIICRERDSPPQLRAPWVRQAAQEYVRSLVSRQGGDEDGNELGIQQSPTPACGAAAWPDAAAGSPL